MRRQKKFYAWGYADEDLSPEEIKEQAGLLVPLSFQRPRAPGARHASENDERRRAHRHQHGQGHQQLHQR